jgi:DNA-binding GntR family transcriptional regulator
LTLARLKGPATFREAVVAQLREAIVLGKLKPGALLKDAEVALKLGLSATPVREALVELAGEGLVEIEPNRRKRVTPMDYQAMVELLEVQHGLWALGYEWGVHRVGPAELKRLRAALASHTKALRTGNVNGAIAAALAFHRVLMDASGNRELLRVSLDRLPLIQRFVLLCAPSIVSTEGLAHHSAILEALERGHADAVLPVFHEAIAVLLTAARSLRDKHVATASNMTNTFAARTDS